MGPRVVLALPRSAVVPHEASGPHSSGTLHVHLAVISGTFTGHHEVSLSCCPAIGLSLNLRGVSPRRNQLADRLQHAEKEGGRPPLRMQDRAKTEPFVPWSTWTANVRVVANVRM